MPSRARVLAVAVAWLPALVVAAPAAADPGPALGVDAGADRWAISSDVYGMNFADEDLAAELALPVRRWGGNATTRYNWQNDTSNRASDWFFENIPNENPSPGTLPTGSSSDRFVEQDRRTGTATVMTVPLIGWTPKSRAITCGFSVAKYGAQQSTDVWQPDCGNGVRTNGTNVTGNDPTDTSLAIGPSFVQSWVAHLVGRFGSAANGGVRYYDLDNEPMLWPHTHRDVHPTPTSYDEVRDRSLAYAAAIKAADPSAQTLGPVVWGWTAYFWSALDAAPGGAWWNDPQDRLAHGDVPFLEWYLAEMQAYEQQSGQRLLDYLDLHYYPQASGVALSGAGGAATQALRLRSTRGLWDPTYVDESWIAAPVRLLPRMRDWVASRYPGTKLAITEYNWGALDHVNGALAQAEVLGVFGRERLDLATLWAPPSASQPGAFAFRMYRNYDGAGGRFGDVSVRATSAAADQLSLFAAERSSDGALTLIAVNKTATPLTSRVTLAGFPAGTPARVYHYGAAAPTAIVRDPDVALAGAALDVTFPATAITLLVVPRATGAATPTPTRTTTPNTTVSPTPPPGAPTATPTPVPTAAVTAIRGTRLAIKDDGDDPTRRVVQFLAKDPAIALDAAGVDPVADGATVQIYNAAGTGESVCLTLARGVDHWRRRGRADRPTYRYADSRSAYGPCKTATLADGTSLAFTCSARRSPIGYSLDEPTQNAVAVRFTSGATTWCALFGGRIQRDSGTDPPVADGSGRFHAKDAPPTTCPAPPDTCP